MKRTYEELTHDVVMRDHWIEELRAENADLAAALMAKDEALTYAKRMIETGLIVPTTGKVTDALDLQPHAALVAKIKADARAEEREAMLAELRVLADKDGNVKLWEV